MAIKRREKIIRVLMTDQEKREVQRAADRVGMALAVFARVATLERARAEAKPDGTK